MQKVRLCEGFVGRWQWGRRLWGWGGQRPLPTRALGRLLVVISTLWLASVAQAQGGDAAGAAPASAAAGPSPAPSPAASVAPGATGPTGAVEGAAKPPADPANSSAKAAGPATADPDPAVGKAAPEPEPEPAPAALLPEPPPTKPNALLDTGLADIAGLPLARLIDRGSVFSGLGSFRQLLPKYGFAAYVHGIAISNFTLQSNPDSSQLPDEAGPAGHNFGGEFSLFVGAELFDRVFVEAQFALDHHAEFTSDFAQIDLRIYRDFIIARAGRFFVPMGGLNIYPEPQYMYPWITPALFYGTVLPGEWGELGFQFHGRYAWGEGRGMSYALYIVNGLEQRVTAPTDPISGGALADMRDNLLDQNDGHKSIGLQWLIEPYPGLVFGVSGYEGIYSVRDGYRLFIADGHTGLRLGKFNLRGEFAATWQETESQLLLKLGGYGLLSYRFKYLEPQLMVDGMRLGGSPDLDRIAASVGVSVFPFPTRVPSASVRLGYSARFKLETGEFATHYGRIEIRVAF